MLQQIRDRISGWFAIVFLGAIAIVFIFWGIQFESATNVEAARVNGEKVPLALVRNAWQGRQQELQQAIRAELPVELVQREQQALLDDFIERELLVQRTQDLGYRVGDAELARTLLEIPALQVDGKFSRDRYAALLRAQGRSESSFEADLRREMQVNQLRSGIAISAFVTPGELKRRAELEGERRTVDFAVVPAARYAGTATVDPAAVTDFYEKNKGSFMTPETTAVQYLELTLAGVADEVEVTEEALHKFYDEVAAERYVVSERRRARHILIETGSDDAAALKKAEGLLAQAKAGADFAELARSNSDDPGSAQLGGDLDWATRDAYLPQFADAVFGMQQGEIRGPVKTQFGYHVIRLDGIEAGGQRPFEEVREELQQAYRSEQAQTLFYERSQQLADDAFAALTDLDTVADKAGLALQSVDAFTREGGGALGNSRDVIDAVFSDEVLRDGHNSAPITIGDDRVVVLRVKDHRQSSQRPLAEVRPAIEASLQRQAAQRAAEAAAKQAVAQLTAGRVLADVAAGLGAVPAGPRSIERSGGADLPGELVRAAFAAPQPQPQKPSAGSVVLGSGDVALFVVSEVQRGAVDEAALSSLVQAAAGQRAQSEFVGYVGELKRNAKIVRNDKAFE